MCFREASSKINGLPRACVRSRINRANKLCFLWLMCDRVRRGIGSRKQKKARQRCDIENELEMGDEIR